MDKSNFCFYASQGEELPSEEVMNYAYEHFTGNMDIIVSALADTDKMTQFIVDNSGYSEEYVNSSENKQALLEQVISFMPEDTFNEYATSFLKELYENGDEGILKAQSAAPKILNPNLEDVLGDFGTDITKYSNGLSLDITQYTPLGEDWHEEFEITDNTIESLIDEIDMRYQNYDPDEEASMWIEGRGQNGVPDSIVDLVKDAQWKEKQLEELVTVLREEYADSGESPVLVDDLTAILEHGNMSLKDNQSDSKLSVYVPSEGKEEFSMHWHLSVSRTIENALFQRGCFQIENEDGDLYEADTLDDLVNQIREDLEDDTYDLYMDVTAYVTNKGLHTIDYQDVRLHAILRNEKGDEFGYQEINEAETFLLSYNEEQAVINRLNELLKDTGKTVNDYFKEGIEKFEAEQKTSENEQKALIEQFRDENFYGDEDIIKSYLQNATVQEVIEFMGYPADSVIATALMSTAEERIGDISPATRHKYAEEYLPKLYAQNIKGDKYLDSLGDTTQQAALLKKAQIERDG